MTTRAYRTGPGWTLLLAALVGVLTTSASASAEPSPARPRAEAPLPLFPLVGSRTLLARPAPLPSGRSFNPHGEISVACEACHTAQAWTPLREAPAFDHDRQTPFALLGRHEQAACRSCHLDLRFDGPDLTQADCASCHLDVHRGQLGTACADCHSPQDFALARGVEAHARTAFPLTGAHVQTDCASCHADAADGLFAPLETACVACHTDDLARTADGPVDHVAAGFSGDCAACHTTLSFDGGTGFEHAAASGGFALVGAHATLACTSCHAPGDLTPLFDASSQDDCAACHAEDFAATAGGAVDHVAAGFPTTCAQCHSVETFAGATVDHTALSGGFTLVGAHVAAPCGSCHVGPDFAVPTDPAGADDCASCHTDEHQAAHPGFPTTCQTCHGTDTFEGATFDHATTTGFPLLGAHVDAACQSCHTGPAFDPIWNASGPDDCATCHQPDHQAAHPGFPTTCATCHTTSTFTGATFDHAAQTGFPLAGAHLSAACQACHTGPDFAPIWEATGAEDCQTCHQADHQTAHPTFPTTCAECHTTTAFAPVTIDHASVSDGFGLVGAHLTAACQSCHSGADFAVPTDPAGAADCAACHAPDHQAAHPTFPTTCAQCHGTDSFEGAAFDHAAATGFPLAGAHVALDCATCHTGPDFAPIWAPSSADDCQTCHAEDHQAAHPAFPTTCATCHTTTSFEDATFDHAAQTGFPLVGSHLALACQSCHTGPEFTPIHTPSGPDDCATCHADDHQAAHPSFPTTCAQCHTTSTFEGATFEHAAVTGFPLVGAHLTLDCASCHTGADFDPIWDPASADDCAACHQPDHQAAHPSFPTTCQTCHSSTTFEGATFDHAATTGFPLVGAHVTLDCASCHSGPDFEPTFNPSSADDCATCHTADHQTAHPTFPTTCATCHTTTSFEDATFDHAAQTGFPLVGSHLALDCASCHTGPDFTPIWPASGPDDCATCHQADHQAAHPTFPTTCQTCHTTSAFAPVTINHAAVSGGFALVGAHVAQPCGSCHTGAAFEVPTNPAGQDDCVACHQPEHQAAHPTFPTTCAQCHTTSTFAGATFNHHQATGFPLVGVHNALACASCHTGPDFDPLFTPANADDCFACHADEYDREHADDGFPTTCRQCHAPDTWQGATFDHDDYFPIYSGKHQGEWGSCQSCHTQPGNFQVFSCITCHEHNRGDMDERHGDKGVRGYVYESTACYSCHPNGED